MKLQEEAPSPVKPVKQEEEESKELTLAEKLIKQDSEEQKKEESIEAKKAE